MPASIDSPAVVYHAPLDVRIEGRGCPPVGDGEVLVQVQACAICGTDIKSYFKGNPRIVPPMVMGHEFCGEIVEVGSGVTQYRLGQRVTMATTIGCGECFYCRRGQSNLCRSAQAMGFAYPGAMAAYILIPARAVRLGHLVDVGGLDATVASLSEPLSCVMNDLSRPPRDQVQSVLIVGLGPLGMLHAAAAKAMGIANVCGVQRPGPRSEMARAMGVASVCSPQEIDARCKELSGGEGFDLVIVTAPHNGAQAASPAYARKGGYVSLFGSLPVGDEFLRINSRTIHYNELTLYGTSDSTPAHVRQAVALLQADTEGFRRLITHRLPLGDFAAAMKEIQAGNAMKVVLQP